MASTSSETSWRMFIDGSLARACVGLLFAILSVAVFGGRLNGEVVNVSEVVNVLRVENISPVSSDLGATLPNSASGGRVNGLAAHPTNSNVYFAASEWGGLFRTSDAGRNWVHVSGHHPQVTWDVEFSPFDTKVLIATSKFDGKTESESGISVSRDGGTTWSNPPSARPAAGDCFFAVDRDEPAAFGIAFDPANANNIYVGTSCGLAVSRDNGRTWGYVDPTPGDGGGMRVWDVVVHNGGIIDICGDEGHLRSTDGGANFIVGATELGGFCSLAVSPDEASVLFMSVGLQIFETRDGGASWPTSFVNPDPQGRIPFVRVNDRVGLAFDLWYGDVSLFRAACQTPADTTSNVPRCPASATWSNAQLGAHSDVGDIAFDPLATVDACPVLFSNDGGVYFNQRTGSNCHDPDWEQPTTSVTALWLWDLAGNVRTKPGAEGVYIGQQDTGAFATRVGGRPTPNWMSPSCCDVFDVEAEQNRVVYTSGFWRTAPVFRMFLADSNMSGGTEIPNYPPGSLLSFNDLDTLSNFAPNSYAVVTTGGVFFTRNIGANEIQWQRLGTGMSLPANACGIYSSRRTDGKVVFFLKAGLGACSIAGGGVGTVWRLVDATTLGNWRPIQRNANSLFGAFGIDRSDARHIVANDVSGPAPHMVRTTDGGISWAVLPEIDQLLIGGGDFVAQVKQGATGNGYAQASLVAINPRDRNMLVVGGHDSGLFVSGNAGTDWHLLSDPRTSTALRPHISRPLFVHFEPLEPIGQSLPFGGVDRWNLYIGARGRGVWRIGLNRRRPGVVRLIPCGHIIPTRFGLPEHPVLPRCFDGLSDRLVFENGMTVFPLDKICWFVKGLTCPGCGAGRCPNFDFHFGNVTGFNLFLVDRNSGKILSKGRGVQSGQTVIPFKPYSVNKTVRTIKPIADLVVVPEVLNKDPRPNIEPPTRAIEIKLRVRP